MNHKDNKLPIHTFKRLKNGVRYRPRFFLAIFASSLIFVLLQIFTTWTWSTALLLSWNLSIFVYLVMTMRVLWNSDHAHILQRAKQQDPSKWIIIFLVFCSIIMCLVAIIVELLQLPKEHFAKIGHIVLSILTIISSWLFMHSVFAIHYAHDFYLAVAKHQDGGLDFPKTPEPTYPEFLYFSYVIGTSAQTADVSITSRSMRVLNILHILLAYGFNTTILAICINVAAGFI